LGWVVTFFARPFFPFSPWWGEGGAKRRMRGSNPRVRNERGFTRGDRPLTRLAAARRATLSHKGERGKRNVTAGSDRTAFSRPVQQSAVIVLEASPAGRRVCGDALRIAGLET